MVPGTSVLGDYYSWPILGLWNRVDDVGPETCTAGLAQQIHHTENGMMTSAPFAKRRLNPRFPFFADAEATLPDGTSVRTQLAEISCQGCYLGALAPISVGTEIRLRIWHHITSCEIEAKVIYLHSGGGLGIFGMGVVFEKMSGQDRTVVDAWLGDLAATRAAASRPSPRN